MMRETDFKIVFAEWKTTHLPALIERDIKIPAAPEEIVSIIGPRQAGKTYRMFQMIKELISKNFPQDNILYINFEHHRLRNLDANDLEDMLKIFYQMFSPDKNLPIYLFLDEIQNVKDWDKWTRRIYDSRKYKVFISGSSSKLSSKEIATSLRGRNIDFTILPFSFKEFLRAEGFKIEDLESFAYLEERGEILKLTEKFLKFGSYPKVVLSQDEKIKEKILQSYYNAIFYRDLVERYRLGPVLLDAFLKYAISCFSKQISISKIYNYLKTLGLKCSKSTLIKFLNVSCEVFFLFPVEIFSYSVKDKKQYPRKLYVVDNGIIISIYPEYKDKIGRLMENTVFVELKRREFEGKISQVFYWKDHQQREVDFVVKKGGKITQLIQVCYEIENYSATKEREIRNLSKASKELKCKDLLVITWDYKEKETYKNKTIKYTPLWKWLLES